MENELESFYITFEDGEGDIIYSDKGFDKVIVNFVGIETTYLKYHLSFSSKSKLPKHVKARCVEEALLPSSTQPSSSIPIVMSKIIYQFWGSSLGFRG